MRKPDPTRIIGRGKRKPDELEMKGFSVSLSTEKPPASPKKTKPPATAVQEYGSAVLQKSRSAAVQEYGTPPLDNLDDYRLLPFREYKKVDARLTWGQKEYLDNLEKLIAREAPGVEKGNPLSKRITRSSIIRALVEIARRLQIAVNPSRFQNERDLIEAVVEAFEQKFREREDEKVQ